jgi:hypothetical protein
VAPQLLLSLRMRKYLLASLLVMGLGGVALADDDAGDSQKPDTQEHQPKTLPAQASATAQANAFGQQGDRMKAAHAAARAAAADAARTAAADHRPATAGLNSHASSHANSHAQAGLAHAAAGAGNGHAHH